MASNRCSSTYPCYVSVTTLTNCLVSLSLHFSAFLFTLMKKECSPVKFDVKQSSYAVQSHPG